MQKVEGGVMRLADGVQTSQPFTAVSKQGHVDGAHEANVPTQARSCRAPGRPGMNDLSADGEACRRLMELDVQLWREEGGGRREDRELRPQERLTSSSFVMCG